MSNQEKNFTGEIGIHYPLHVLNRYSLPELIGLAERAWQTLGGFGFTQVWTNDNLEYRSVLASSAAIVARLPVKLGTAVTVPYFRNPVDLAMAFATISELTNGQEISLGLGPGSRSILTHQVDRVKPLAIMAELAAALRKLFAGDSLRSSEIPVLASYFHLNAEQYALRFKAQSPIRLYYGPSLLKPAVLDLISHTSTASSYRLSTASPTWRHRSHVYKRRGCNLLCASRCAKSCCSTHRFRATGTRLDNMPNASSPISPPVGRTKS